MKKILFLALILLLLAGCSASVSVKDINTNPEKYMGKKVSVTGEVIAPLQLGQMSGFTLKDDESSIIVSSDMVPKAGNKVTVKGTVVKGLFSTHYIFADTVR